MVMGTRRVERKGRHAFKEKHAVSHPRVLGSDELDE
jgi:hypothetical protein